MGATAAVHGSAAPQRVSGPRNDLVDVLREVAVLRDSGVLTEAEFKRFRTDVVAERRAARPQGDSDRDRG